MIFRRGRENHPIVDPPPLPTPPGWNGQAAWQVQEGPQAQASPHWQLVACAGAAGAAAWQPQVQVAPGQLVQLHFVVWVDMVLSSGVGGLPC